MDTELTQGADQAQMEALLAQEIAAGARLVVYEYVVSVVILTFRRSSGVKFVRAGESRLFRGLPYVLLTLCLGWWGIPWGPLFSVGALVTDLRGGKDVTPARFDAVRQPAAW
jgi:hypothetical protein